MFMLIYTYSLITERMMSMLNCVEVQPFGRRLRLAANLRCFEGSILYAQLLSCVVLAFLVFPFPVYLMWFKEEMQCAKETSPRRSAAAAVPRG